MNNLFWGIIILLFGVFIILKAIFGFGFPIIRVAAGLFWVYFGLGLILSIWPGRTMISFGNKQFKDYRPAREYSIVFGKGTIDLSQMALPEKPVHVKMNTVFGKSQIILNKDIPTQLQLNSIFSNIELPYQQIQQTASNFYSLGNEKPVLYLEINVVFGTSWIELSSDKK